MSDSKKSVITADSIRAAVAGGANSLTQVSKAHGYAGAVSGNISKKIRQLVPEIAELMAGVKPPVVAVAVVEPVVELVAVAPVEPVVEPVVELIAVAPVEPVAPPVVEPVEKAKKEKPARRVKQVKGLYRGMYGVVFSQAAAAGEVKVKEFIPTLTANIMADPSNAKIVDKIRDRKGDADLVAQVEKAITFALGVIRSPKHLSNSGRSDDVSTVRGNMHIVALNG